MPVAKIHILAGQYDEARLGKVSRAVQDALMSALGVPPDDFFQIIHILPRRQFLHARQNHRMMTIDVCDPSFARNVHRRLFQAALAPSGREPVSSPPAQHRVEARTASVLRAQQ